MVWFLRLQFSAQRILPSEHNFWFTLYPQTPCLFRLTAVRWGSHGDPEVLRRGRLPHPPSETTRPQISWEDPRQGLGSVPPPHLSSSPSSLLADRSCAPVSRAALRGSTPATPWCSCWAGWVGPGDLHVKARLVLTMSLYVNLFPGKGSQNRFHVYPQGQLK